ncbi:hypothetical protein DH2020_029090 [Rehmannia glutinosa]|uniref:Uncharacterized protein n=1 Tax=Rehmannia glutinosa TaxID=99300 RepID=A0ABR0VPK9_REHGL
MALTPVQYAVVVASLGISSFIFGIFAELKKPVAGEAITGKGVVICKYPSDPSIFLGYISSALLVAASIAGYLSFFIHTKANLFQGMQFSAPDGALLTSQLHFQGHIHHTKNVHTDLEFDCATAKTGLLGGGAFASLNSSLLWLISLMLATNAREDYFLDAESSELI